jgi:hypothetical protein
MKKGNKGKNDDEDMGELQAKMQSRQAKLKKKQESAPSSKDDDDTSSSTPAKSSSPQAGATLDKIQDSSSTPERAAGTTSKPAIPSLDKKPGFASRSGTSGSLLESSVPTTPRSGMQAGIGGLPANKEAAIRSGKREKWRWETHEGLELQLRLSQQQADGKAVFLWLFDDICLAHTKRRVLNMEGTLSDGPDSVQVTTIAESAGETLAGLKQVLRQILSGQAKGLRFTAVANTYKERTETALDDELAKALGYDSLDDLLYAMPDAVRREGDRLVGTREATRHEVETWIITQGGKQVPGATCIIDEAGEISAQKISEVCWLFFLCVCECMNVHE